LAAALWVLLGGDNWEWQNGFLLGGEPLHLRLDGLSALFLLLVAVGGEPVPCIPMNTGRINIIRPPPRAVVSGGAPSCCAWAWC
jgi:hypothetical protein